MKVISLTLATCFCLAASVTAEGQGTVTLGGGRPTQAAPATPTAQPSGEAPQAPAAGYVANYVPPSTLCGRITEAIEDALKDVSMQQAEEFADDSAPRATMRGARNAASFASIQANLAQLAPNHCAPFAHALTYDAYSIQADLCRFPEAAQKTGMTRAVACNQHLWVRVLP